MTTTKNTTPTERRIGRREALATSLKTLAVTIEKLGANAGFVREAATELLIGNVHLVLEEALASDDASLRDAMKRDPIETGRTTVTVGAVNIPGRREPGIALQASSDGRLAPARPPIRPVKVLISGPQGSGKSRLADLVREQLEPIDGVEIIEGLELPPGARFVPDPPEITDAMVDRAVDAWQQFWSGLFYTDFAVAQRDAIRHVLQQALAVKP